MRRRQKIHQQKSYGKRRRKFKQYVAKYKNNKEEKRSQGNHSEAGLIKENTCMSKNHPPPFPTYETIVIG